MLVSFFGTAITLHFLIPVLKSKKMGQKILDIGPRWHKDKEGTPTMCGIAFLIFITLSAVFVWGYLFFIGNIEAKELYGLLLTALYAVSNGIIGLIDDARKLKRKRNEGLTAREKYLLQLISAAFYVVALVFLGAADTSVYIPFFGIYLDLGIFWYPLTLLFLTGFVNAVNLTDGIDGLCATVSAVVALFMSAYCLWLGEGGGTALYSALLGGCLGFLIYNLHPAKGFMGDTGSLFLGALISGAALTLGDPITLFFVGAVYLSEAVSVIIQVVFFKLTGKRVFLMAPLHHHFEKKGMTEMKITALFAAVTAALSFIVLYFG